MYQGRGNRQNRPWNHRVAPATPEERLASMERELNRRVMLYGEDHWLTQMQHDTMKREKTGQQLAQLQGVA